MLEKEYRQSQNYTPGRTNGVRFIVIHHWGQDGQKHENVVNWLRRPDGDSSAHYVVSAYSDGSPHITQLVAEMDTAWHAGPGNDGGIGIECRPEMTAADINAVKELIADIVSRYGTLEIYPHKHFMNTACPGRWEAIIPELEGTEAHAHDYDGDLVIDGFWGTATTFKLQKVLEFPWADGEISSQNDWEYENPGLTTGWDWRGDSGYGSPTIEMIQRLLGVTVDGLIGPETISAIQKKLGTIVDGYFDEESPAIIKLQKNLNEGKIF